MSIETSSGKLVAIKRSIASIFLRFGAVPIQIAIIVILARAMDEQSLGVYFLIISTGTIVGRVATLGLNQAIIKLTAEQLKSKCFGLKRLFTQLIGIVALSSAIISIVFGLWGGEYLGHIIFGSPIYAGTSSLLALWLFFFALQSMGAGMMEALQRTHLATLVMPGGMVRQLGLLFLLLIIWIFGVQLNIYILIWFLLAVSVLACLITFLLAVRSEAIGSGGKNTELKHVLDVSWPLLISAFVIGWMREMDTWIVAGVTNETQLAYYRASARIAELALMIEGVLMVVIRPYLAELLVKQRHKQISVLVNAYSLITLGLVLPFVFLCIIAADPILTLLFGQGFSEGSSPMIIRVIGLAALLALGPAQALLQVSDHGASLLKSMYFGVPVQALLVYFGAIEIGTIGAAGGWVLGMLMTRLLMVVACITKLGINPTISLSAESFKNLNAVVKEILRFRKENQSIE